MEAVKIILIILEVLASVGLIATVLLQSSNEAGMGAIAGKNETYMGKNKAATFEKKMALATKIIAVVWLVLTLALNFV